MREGNEQSRRGGSRLRGGQALRVGPKLRMVYNGDAAVNGRRAQRSAVVGTTKQFRQPAERTAAGTPPWKPAQGIRVGAFVELEESHGSVTVTGASNRAQRDKLVTVDLPLGQLDRLAKAPGVAYVTAGEVLQAPNPITEPITPAGPDPRSLGSFPPPRRGSVLLGFVDVGGFDFAHPDFLHAGKTRFVGIWDQGLVGGNAPAGFDYGVELTGADLQAAVAGARTHGLAATDLRRQSLQMAGSHATHVASIAGGNAGVCPTAYLAGVSLALPDRQVEGRSTFFDSVRLAHAVDYLLSLGEQLQVPVVVNLSVGTNGHAHDGTSPISRWIETALDQPGRCVVVAAGNAGQAAPHSEGDLGFLSGRIHTSGRVEAEGLVVDLEWDVLGNGAEDYSDNEMEVWYEPQDQFRVYVKPPGVTTWIGPVGPGEYFQNKELADRTFLSVYSERYLPANGANRISVFLSPRLLEPRHGVAPGRWLVRLEGQDIHDGRFHAWIERDDIRQLPGSEGWMLPSTFSPTTNVDASSVSSLACGQRVIAVANYDQVADRIHDTSSQGPTRDGRQKPDLAAPGTAISAANGFGTPDRPWVAKTGTSMASPYVAGVAARMLARDRKLRATQVIGIMRRTARPLPGHTYRWQDGAGFGRIDPVECLHEVDRAFVQRDLEDRS